MNPPSRPSKQAIPKPKRIIFLAHVNGSPTSVIILTGPPHDVSEGDAIKSADIVKWLHLVAPNWPAPASDCPLVRSLAYQLNQIRVSEPLRADRNDPVLQRIDRVTKAIRVLVADLPNLIASVQSSSRQAGEGGAGPDQTSHGVDRLHALEGLYAASQAAAGTFYRTPPIKKDEPWHDVAALIAWAAEGIWRRAGRQRVGRNPTSPLVKLIALVLPRVGETSRTKEAISKALHRHEGIVGEVEIVQDNPV